IVLPPLLEPGRVTAVDQIPVLVVLSDFVHLVIPPFVWGYLQYSGYPGKAQGAEHRNTALPLPPEETPKPRGKRKGAADPLAAPFPCRTSLPAFQTVDVYQSGERAGISYLHVAMSR